MNLIKRLRILGGYENYSDMFWGYLAGIVILSMAIIFFPITMLVVLDQDYGQSISK